MDCNHPSGCKYNGECESIYGMCPYVHIKGDPIAGWLHQRCKQISKEEPQGLPCGHDGKGYMGKDYTKSPTICTRPKGHAGRHSCEIKVKGATASRATVTWMGGLKLLEGEE